MVAIQQSAVAGSPTKVTRWARSIRTTSPSEGEDQEEDEEEDPDSPGPKTPSPNTFSAYQSSRLFGHPLMTGLGPGGGERGSREGHGEEGEGSMSKLYLDEPLMDFGPAGSGLGRADWGVDGNSRNIRVTGGDVDGSGSRTWSRGVEKVESVKPRSNDIFGMDWTALAPNLPPDPSPPSTADEGGDRMDTEGGDDNANKHKKEGSTSSSNDIFNTSWTTDGPNLDPEPAPPPFSSTNLSSPWTAEPEGSSTISGPFAERRGRSWLEGDTGASTRERNDTLTPLGLTPVRPEMFKKASIDRDLPDGYINESLFSSLHTQSDSELTETLANPSQPILPSSSPSRFLSSINNAAANLTAPPLRLFTTRNYLLGSGRNASVYLASYLAETPPDPSSSSPPPSPSTSPPTRTGTGRRGRPQRWILTAAKVVDPDRDSQVSGLNEAFVLGRLGRHEGLVGLVGVRDERDGVVVASGEAREGEKGKAERQMDLGIGRPGKEGHASSKTQGTTPSLRVVTDGEIGIKSGLGSSHSLSSRQHGSSYISPQDRNGASSLSIQMRQSPIELSPHSGTETSPTDRPQSISTQHSVLSPANESLTSRDHSHPLQPSGNSHSRSVSEATGTSIEEQRRMTRGGTFLGPGPQFLTEESVESLSNVPDSDLTPSISILSSSLPQSTLVIPPVTPTKERSRESFGVASAGGAEEKPSDGTSFHHAQGSGMTGHVRARRAVSVREPPSSASPAPKYHHSLASHHHRHPHVHRMPDPARFAAVPHASPSATMPHPPRIILLLEYCSRGNLHSFVKKYPDLVGKRLWLKWAKSVAGALELMHSKGFVHADVKPQNLCLTDNLDAKLCDFGMSFFVSPTTPPPTDGLGLGTQAYAPPELVSTPPQPFSFPIDVYAFGVALWALITGREPFESVRSPVEMMLWIRKGGFWEWEERRMWSKQDGRLSQSGSTNVSRAGSIRSVRSAGRQSRANTSNDHGGRRQRSDSVESLRSAAGSELEYAESVSSRDASGNADLTPAAVMRLLVQDPEIGEEEDAEGSEERDSHQGGSTSKPLQSHQPKSPLLHTVSPLRSMTRFDSLDRSSRSDQDMDLDNETEVEENYRPSHPPSPYYESASEDEDEESTEEGQTPPFYSSGLPMQYFPNGKDSVPGVVVDLIKRMVNPKQERRPGMNVVKALLDSL